MNLEEVELIKEFIAVIKDLHEYVPANRILQFDEKLEHLLPECKYCMITRKAKLILGTQCN
jgi:hypothetical protein